MLDNDARPPARRRLRQFRVPVLVAALLAVLAATRGLNVLVAGTSFLALALAIGLGTAVAALVCYHWLTRTVENREVVPELARTGRRRALARGGVLGFSLFTAMMLIIGMFGGWEHLGGGSLGGSIASIGAVASIAVNEELLFRGVVFRILEERAGSVIALPASSLIFGLTHLVNDHATLWGTLALGIEGGILTAAAYLASRSLWLPIGLNFVWDYTHIGVFGLPTSSTVGETENGLLHTTLAGPDPLTGGLFGPRPAWSPSWSASCPRSSCCAGRPGPASCAAGRRGQPPGPEPPPSQDRAVSARGRSITSTLHRHSRRMGARRDRPARADGRRRRRHRTGRRTNVGTSGRRSGLSPVRRGLTLGLRSHHRLLSKSCWAALCSSPSGTKVWALQGSRLRPDLAIDLSHISTVYALPEALTALKNGAQGR